MGSGHTHAAPLAASYLGRLDARAKILAVIPAIFLVNLFPAGRWLPVVAVAAVFAVLLAACGHGALSVLKRAALFAPFVLFVVVTLPFSAAGGEVFTVNLGFARLVATDEGLARSGEVALKAATSILGVLVLSGSTEAPALFKGLRSLGVPRAFVTVLSMVYRYLFEIGDEFTRVRRSATARGFQVRDFHAIPRMSNMAAALLTRSVVRSQRVHNNMLARGFDGEVRTLSHAHFGRRDAAFLCAFYAAVATAIMVTAYA